MSAALVDTGFPVVTDDSELRRRISVGDPAAIAECYRTHATLVRQYVARFVAHHEVDDVTQAVFYELWRSAQRYDPDRSLRAWLLGIARKRSIDQLRRCRPAEAVLVPLHAVGDLAGVDGRELADRRDSAAVMIAALAKLPAAQSAVLRLAYFDGYTQTEIAALLLIPLGTVKTRSSRGLRGLGRILCGATDLPRPAPVSRHATTAASTSPLRRAASC